MVYEKQIFPPGYKTEVSVSQEEIGKCLIFRGKKAHFWSGAANAFVIAAPLEFFPKTGRLLYIYSSHFLSLWSDRLKHRANKLIFICFESPIIEKFLICFDHILEEMSAITRCAFRRSSR